jgi:hypothetical protein
MEQGSQILSGWNLQPVSVGMTLMGPYMYPAGSGASLSHGKSP